MEAGGSPYAGRWDAICGPVGCQMGAAVECHKIEDQKAVLGRPAPMRGTMIFEKRNFQLFICFYQKVHVNLHIATILTSHTHHEEN